jgi:hypothetical protein
MKRKRRQKRNRRYSPAMPVVTSNRTGWIWRPHVVIDRSLAWFAVWTAPRAEREAEIRLRRAGFATYLPSFADKRLRKGQIQPVETLAVSRYLFVGINAASLPLGAVAEALREEETSGAVVFEYRGKTVTVDVGSAPPEPIGRVIGVRGEALRVPASALQSYADGLSGNDIPVRGGVLGKLLEAMQRADDARLRERGPFWSEAA